MHTCVYTYTYTYIHTYIHTYIRLFRSIRLFIDLSVYIYTYVFFRTYASNCTCIHVSMWGERERERERDRVIFFGLYWGFFGDGVTIAGLDKGGGTSMV